MSNILSSLLDLLVVAIVAAGCAIGLVIIVVASRFLVEWALLHPVAAAVVASLGLASLAFRHFLLRGRGV